MFTSISCRVSGNSQSEESWNENCEAKLFYATSVGNDDDDDDDNDDDDDDDDNVEANHDDDDDNLSKCPKLTLDKNPSRGSEE